MAIAVDATSTGGQTTVSNSLSWSHTCTGSNLLLIVCLNEETADDITGVTYNSVALTRAVKGTGVVGTGRPEIWYLIGPSTGANTITISRTGTTGRLCGGAASYTGCSQSAQPDSFNSNTASSSTTLSVSTTVVASNCWLVMHTDTSAAGESAGTGTTLRQAMADASDIWDSNGTVGTGSQALAINAASGNLTGAIVSIAPAVTSFEWYIDLV